MDFKLWLETVVNVNIEDILPDKDNMEVAVDSLYKGRYSDDLKPITVYQNGDKYVVGDGHHRLLQAILQQKATVNVQILPGTVSTKNTVPLDFYDGEYYGLDSSLKNGWLLKRI